MLRATDLIGKVIDSYQIQAILGKGGMGVVFKAVDTSLDKVVALKVMNPQLAEDERFLGRFKSEAKALGRLHHPNIVNVFALRHVDPYLFIVMEFVKGANLADLIKRDGAMSIAQTLPIMQQSLRAIDYAHGEEIIHRDIKPHNILLSPKGIAKVTDFGLAKIQVDHSESMMATRTGFTGGTLYYMPPEQLEGLLHVDHRGDIYGLGMTYYEMLAGKTPFDKTSSEFVILKAIDASDFPSLGEYNEAIPAPLVDIVMKALERDPEDRYQTAGEMLAALEAWMADASFDAQAAGPSSKASPGLLGGQATAPPEDRKDVLKSLRSALGKGGGKEEKGEEAHPDTVLIDKAPRHSRHQPDTPAEPDRATAEAKKTREHDTVPLASASQKQEETPASTETPPPPIAPGPKKATDAKAVPGATGAPAKKAPGPVAPHTPRPIWQRPVFIVGGLLVIVVAAYLGLQISKGGEPVQASTAGLSLDTTAALAALTIRTQPEEALVYLDSLQVGNTPLVDYALSVGSKVLHIEKDGYVSVDTMIVLDTTQAAVFSFTLAQEGGTEEEELEEATAAVLIVQSEPSEAEVLLDGVSVGQTPLTVEEPALGEHALVLRKRGYQDIARTVTIEEGKESLVEETLAAFSGTLEITARPLGDIYVDGMLKAQRSSEPYTQDVSTGVYAVRVVHPEYGAWERQIRVDTSGTHAFLFNFDQEFEVAVTSEPGRADILVDGQPAGKRTPGVVKVRPGRRTIAVRRRGFVMDGAAHVITLDRNRTNEPLHFTLREVQ